MSLAERVSAAFEQEFGGAPEYIVRAPGRVNLIGEHTDYNDGFVLPMAIDRGLWIALRPRADRRVVLRALDLDDRDALDLDGPLEPRSSWLDYIAGVVELMRHDGMTLRRGLEGALAGDVPAGAGLSSSAALELAAARALAAVNDLPWDAARMARVAQRAEVEFVGVNCGIMDQLISASGRAGAALLIDCRSLACEPVPLPESLRVVVLDTGTRRGLVDSEYNERRASCERAAAHFGVRALRDLDLSRLTGRGGGLDHRTLRRARHVVSENARTLAAAEALRRDDVAALGRLLDESHESLARDFGVSSAALDAMVACAREADGCLGTRMTGAGFGGCAVALVEAGRVAPFVAQVTEAYQEATGRVASAHVCQAADGVAVIDGR